MSERQVTRGALVIAKDRCKGCDLCIPACPPGVLKMSKDFNALGYLYPILEAGCTGCTACQQVCPDYVFEVYKLEQPVEHAEIDAGKN